MPKVTINISTELTTEDKPKPMADTTPPIMVILRQPYLSTRLDQIGPISKGTEKNSFFFSVEPESIESPESFDIKRVLFFALPLPLPVPLASDVMAVLSAAFMVIMLFLSMRAFSSCSCKSSEDRLQNVTSGNRSCLMDLLRGVVLTEATTAGESSVLLSLSGVK
ncbi:hypothetical protein FF38_11401 [Lucilia cuprina]|uniref:Uncharacterized protein n=1 Tax=Lucilia cuprina TaxID=7375 RepID=A0A0L0C324_LUCCU|nr:hypothetical protein FF38_11401 [Lucilia cuprina]